MSKIKTFPLHFVDEKLEEISKEAKLRGFSSTKDFVLFAIDKALENKDLKQEVK